MNEKYVWVVTFGGIPIFDKAGLRFRGNKYGGDDNGNYMHNGEIVGIYSTEEKAKKYEKSIKSMLNANIEIEKHSLDGHNMFYVP